MEYEHGRGSSRHSRTHFEATYNEGKSLSRSSSSSSSSSSDSSLKLDIDEKDASSSLFSLGSQGPISSPEISPYTSFVSMQSGSVMQAPPPQVMGKPGGYDPNRIPASVFSSKPGTPVEWSVASNESLFSIHVGNSSFSRDHYILLSMSQELTKSNEVSNFPASVPPVTEAVGTKRMNANIGNGSEVTEMSAETTKAVLSETTEDHREEQLPPAKEVLISINTSYRFDYGDNSTRSFAFPVLTGEGGRFSSVTVDPEKQQSQPQTPGVTPNAAGTKLFSCFPCCSLCC